MFKPKKDEIYYIPFFEDKKLFRWRRWGDYESDKLLYELGLTFKLEEEAITKAKQMLCQE